MSSTSPPPGGDPARVADPSASDRRGAPREQPEVGASADLQPGRVARFRRAWATRSTAYRRQGVLWKAAAPAAFVLAGALFVTSAVSSDGTELRAARYGDLASVVRGQTSQVDALNKERDALAAEVEDLASRLGGTGVSAAQKEVDLLEVPAGLAPMAGPGITVELDDASAEQIEASGTNPKFLVVHQQDIQAVANAMWAGGAEAMTIQGQRVIATTGIKCVGSTVVLRGVPYSPPYVITAVGDPVAMLDSIDDSADIQRYREYADRYGLGWDILPHSSVEVPAYTGSVDLDYARPAEGHTSREDDDL